MDILSNLLFLKSLLVINLIAFVIIYLIQYDNQTFISIIFMFNIVMQIIYNKNKLYLLNPETDLIYKISILSSDILLIMFLVKIYYVII